MRGFKKLKEEKRRLELTEMYCEFAFGVAGARGRDMPLEGRLDASKTPQACPASPASPIW